MILLHVMASVRRGSLTVVMLTQGLEGFDSEFHDCVSRAAAVPLLLSTLVTCHCNALPVLLNLHGQTNH